MGCYGYCNEHLGLHKKLEICSVTERLSGSGE
jgi:hypothetical protein